MKRLIALIVIILMILGCVVYGYKTKQLVQRSIECAKVLNEYEYNIVKEFEDLPYSYDYATKLYNEQEAEYNKVEEYYGICDKIDKNF